MPVSIEVKGLEQARRRFAQFPRILDEEAKKTMEQSLLHLQGSVPAYPPPPATSSYKRTGQLGRSMGVGMNGGKLGKPDIYRIKKVGRGYEGHFGSSLSYAGRVIGERQESPWVAYWWNIKTVAQRAQRGIERLFSQMADRIANRLNQ